MVWRPMTHPLEALVRMVSPSPTMNDDKVSQGGERGGQALPTQVILIWKLARPAEAHWPVGSKAVRDSEWICSSVRLWQAVSCGEWLTSVRIVP